jgi:serine protease AprX
VAVGSHVQGLRVPNGYVDANHPESRVGDRYFRGSGTSEATAITSGAIALILEKYPTLTPDQVKDFITGGAQKVPGADTQAQGAGELSLTALAGKRPRHDPQNRKASKGNGLLESSRGADYLSRGGVVLSGEVDVFGQPVDTSALAAAEASGNAWSGDTWSSGSWD